MLCNLGAQHAHRGPLHAPTQYAYTTTEFIFGLFAELVLGFIYGALAGLMSATFMSQNAAEQVTSCPIDQPRPPQELESLPFLVV